MPNREETKIIQNIGGLEPFFFTKINNCAQNKELTHKTHSRITITSTRSDKGVKLIIENKIVRIDSDTSFHHPTQHGVISPQPAVVDEKNFRCISVPGIMPRKQS